MIPPRAMTLGRGILIAIDGIDGAGKTTQARALEEEMKRLGLMVVQEKEPTDGPDGATLRASAVTGRLGRDEELRLFHADRLSHVRTCIKPCLENGTVVVLDRYYYSTAAYQGRNAADAEVLLKHNEGFAPTPDLAVILDIDPALAVRRLLDRGGANRFETLEGLNASRDLFLGLRRPELRVLNGERPACEITVDLLDLVRPIMAQRLDEIADAMRGSNVPVADQPSALRARHLR